MEETSADRLRVAIGLHGPVENRGHQDGMDLAASAAVATADGWRLARDAVALITERGFAVVATWRER